MIHAEQPMEKDGLSYLRFSLMEVINVELGEGRGTCRMKEARLECLK